MLSQQLCKVTQSCKNNFVGILESSWSTHRDVCAIEIRNTVTSLIRTPKGQYRMCALQRCLCYSDRKYNSLFNKDSKRTVSSVRIKGDVYLIVIGNTVRSLIRTPKGQYQVCALQKCLCYSDRKYIQLFNTEAKRTCSIKSAHYKDEYVIDIGNTFSFLIRTPKGQYQVCALQRYLCYSDTINTVSSSVVNTDSKRTVSSVRIIEMSMLQ